MAAPKGPASHEMMNPTAVCAGERLPASRAYPQQARHAAFRVFDGPKTSVRSSHRDPFASK